MWECGAKISGLKDGGMNYEEIEKERERESK